MPIKLGTIEYLKSLNLVPKNNMVGYWPLDGSANDFSENNTLNNGLVAYWKLDESSGNAADSSGNGKTLVNVGTVPFVSAKIGNGIQGNGSTNRGMRLWNDNCGLTADSQNWSYNMFVKLSGWNGYLTQILTTGGATAYFLIYGGGGGADSKIHFYISSNEVVSSTVSLDTWYMVTIVKTGTTYEFFLNNVSQGTTTKGSQTVTYQTTTLGNSTNSSQNFDNVPMNAIEDEVGIWNKSLTPSERAALYANGTGCTYPFSPYRNNNHGTVTGAIPVPSQNPAIPASLAYKFNGSSDYIALSDSAFDFEYTQPLWLSCWIKPNYSAYAATAGNILGKFDQNSPYIGYSFGVQARDSVLKFQYYQENNNTITGKRMIALAGNVVNYYNRWIKLDITYDGSGNNSGVKFYINGNKLTTETTAGSDYLSNNGSILNNKAAAIGRYNAEYSQDYFNGQIQDLALFNRVGSHQEIKSIYNASKWRYKSKNILAQLGIIIQALAVSITLTANLSQKSISKVLNSSIILTGKILKSIKNYLSSTIILTSNIFKKIIKTFLSSITLSALLSEIKQGKFKILSATILLSSTIKKDIFKLFSIILNLSIFEQGKKIISRIFNSSINLSINLYKKIIKTIISDLITLGSKKVFLKMKDIYLTLNLNINKTKLVQKLFSSEILLSSYSTIRKVFKQVLNAVILLSSKTIKGFFFSASLTLSPFIGILTNAIRIIPKVISFSINKKPKNLSIDVDKKPKLYR